MRVEARCDSKCDHPDTWPAYDAHDTRKLATERTSPGGMVMIDQDADAGAMIGDPAEFERRFHRARRAAPNMYEAGDAGRDRFREDDRLHVDSGLDLVRSLERGNELRAAGQRQAQVRRQLEQALVGERDQCARVRTLDAEIAKLREERDRIAPSIAPEARPASGLRLLDTDASHDAHAREVSPKAREVADRIRAQARDSDEFMRLLDQELNSMSADELSDPGWRTTVMEDPKPASAAPAAAAGTTPGGVDPDWQALDRRVRDRLVQLGRPESEYPRMLEEVMAEDRDADLGVIRGPLDPRRQS